MYKRNLNYLLHITFMPSVLTATFSGLMHFQLTDCSSSLNHSTPFSAVWIQEQP